jgi:hypothetical protein
VKWTITPKKNVWCLLCHTERWQSHKSTLKGPTSTDVIQL